MRREQCCSLVLALLAACSSGEKNVPALGDAGRPVAAAPEPLPGDTTCAATGYWARCSIIRSIERAGLNAHADSAKEVKEPTLSIPGFELPISRGTVRFFVYADSDSRKRDQLRLDTSLFVSAAKDPSQRKRTLVPIANLLVLMDVMNTRNRERIANAMMAGAPQPPSKKP
jgi:hypothetical protein